MQKNKNLKRNIAIVLLNIFIVVSLILVLILKNDYGYRLYWVITPLLMVLVILLINKWSVRGLDMVSKESKVIQITFDDTTTLSTVFFGLIYLIIQGAECFKENITHNQYIIIGFFIVMVAYELFTYVAIYTAKRDTAKLLEEEYNKKK